MLSQAQNVIHQLFFELGVDLDYVPVDKYEAFTMLLQFGAAMWFICWLLKFCYTFMRGALRGSRY